MKNLTTTILTVFLALCCLTNANAQGKTRGKVLMPGSPGTFAVLGGGLLTPSSDAKDNANVVNSSTINADVFLPLLRKEGSNFNFGVNLGGSYSFGGSGNPSTPLPAAYAVTGATSSSVAYKRGGDPIQAGFLTGIGPQANFYLGKFIVSPMVLGEYFSMTQKEVNAVQTTESNGQSYDFNLATMPETKTSGFAVTPKVRIHYMINEHFGFFADAAYTMGPKAEIATSKLIPNGAPNQGGSYTVQQLQTGTTTKGETKSTALNSVGFNFGVVIGLDKAKYRDDTHKGWNGKGKANTDDIKKGWNGKTVDVKPTENETQKEFSNNEIFTATHIKKENTQKPNCIQILSPSNGSNQSINENVKILLNNDDIKQSIADVKIYKISNDKNFWNKAENLKQLMDNNNTVFLSGRFEKESESTGFKPISVNTKQSGAVLESSIDKGKLSEGAYKMVVISNCGVTTSNFSVTPCDVHLNITNISDVCEGYEKNGFKHKICFTSNYQSSNCNLTFASATAGLKIYDASLSPIAFTQVSGFPLQTQLQGVATNKNYCIEIITNSPSILIALQGEQCSGSVTTQCIPGVEATLDLKSCICDFCEKVLEFDSGNTGNPVGTNGGVNTSNIIPNSTYSATNNSLSIHQDWWNMNSAAATVVGAKAEIISFERQVSDDCMKCDKNSNQWGNFISGNSGTTNGSFGNATGTVTGNTHHTLYFASPVSYQFDLNISLPPISTLACCCEKIKFRVRYTYTFKDNNGDCKMCSTVFEYYYQRGQCPILHNPGNPTDATSGTKNDIKINKN